MAGPAPLLLLGLALALALWADPAAAPDPCCLRVTPYHIQALAQRMAQRFQALEFRAHDLRGVFASFQQVHGNVSHRLRYLEAEHAELGALVGRLDARVQALEADRRAVAFRPQFAPPAAPPPPLPGPRRPRPPRDSDPVRVRLALPLETLESVGTSPTAAPPTAASSVIAAATGLTASAPTASTPTAPEANTLADASELNPIEAASSADWEPSDVAGSQGSEWEPASDPALWEDSAAQDEWELAAPQSAGGANQRAGAAAGGDPPGDATTSAVGDGAAPTSATEGPGRSQVEGGVRIASQDAALGHGNRSTNEGNQEVSTEESNSEGSRQVLIAPEFFKNQEASVEESPKIMNKTNPKATEDVRRNTTEGGGISGEMCDAAENSTVGDARSDGGSSPEVGPCGAEGCATASAAGAAELEAGAGTEAGGEQELSDAELGAALRELDALLQAPAAAPAPPPDPEKLLLKRALKLALAALERTSDACLRLVNFTADAFEGLAAAEV